MDESYTVSPHRHKLHMQWWGFPPLFTLKWIKTICTAQIPHACIYTWLCFFTGKNNKVMCPSHSITLPNLNLVSWHTLYHNCNTYSCPRLACPLDRFRKPMTSCYTMPAWAFSSESLWLWIAPHRVIHHTVMFPSCEVYRGRVEACNLLLFI